MKAGYQVQITSWENDADNYKTEIISGIKTKEDVKFLLDYVRKFTSKNHSKDPGLGNHESTEQELRAALADVWAKNPNASEDIGPKPDEHIDYIMEFTMSLLGTPGEYYEWGFCRVFESFQVFYFEVPPTELTEEFK